jgi:ChrR Cupin-like domain
MRVFRSKAVFILTIVVLAAASYPPYSAFGETSGFVAVTPGDLTWGDYPERPGLKIAVIEGDLKAAGPFTVRLKFPANAKLQPHWHGITEHVTVISGMFYLGLGDQFDEARAKALPPGSAVVNPAGTHHFAFTKEEVVIQVHGIGPWTMTPVAQPAKP